MWYLIEVILGFIAIAMGIIKLVKWRGIHKWPQATAVITSTRIDQGRSNVHTYNGDSVWVDSFSAVIEYEFTAAHKIVKGEWYSPNYRGRYDKIRANVYRYSVGTELQIRFDQHNPIKTYNEYELKGTFSMGIGLVFGGAVLCLGGILIGLNIVEDVVLSLFITFVVSVMAFTSIWGGITKHKGLFKNPFAVTERHPLAEAYYKQGLKDKQQGKKAGAIDNFTKFITHSDDAKKVEYAKKQIEELSRELNPKLPLGS
jgi:hypothetical protein